MVLFWVAPALPTCTHAIWWWRWGSPPRIERCRRLWVYAFFKTFLFLYTSRGRRPQRLWEKGIYHTWMPLLRQTLTSFHSLFLLKSLVFFSQAPLLRSWAGVHYSSPQEGAVQRWPSLTLLYTLQGHRFHKILIVALLYPGFNCKGETVSPHLTGGNRKGSDSI